MALRVIDRNHYEYFSRLYKLLWWNIFTVHNVYDSFQLAPNQLIQYVHIMQRNKRMTFKHNSIVSIPHTIHHRYSQKPLSVNNASSQVSLLDKVEDAS